MGSCSGMRPTERRCFPARPDNLTGAPRMSRLNDPPVLFAAVRSLMAWGRTSISLMAFGVVIEWFDVFIAISGKQEI